MNQFVILSIIVLFFQQISGQHQYYQQQPQQQPIVYALQPPQQQQQQQQQQNYNIHPQQQMVLPREPAPIMETQLAHRAVIENSINESHLPAEYQRSINFYKHPKIAEALAKDSQLTDKEMPVFDREAEKIPREQVYKIFKNAGFIHKRK